MFDVCDSDQVTSDTTIIASGGCYRGQTGKSSVLVSVESRFLSIHEAVCPGDSGRVAVCVRALKLATVCNHTLQTCRDSRDHLQTTFVLINLLRDFFSILHFPVDDRK